MRYWEIIAEAKTTIRDQIMVDVRKAGGSQSDYFVRFTGVDKLGFSAKQQFGRTIDVDDPDFNIDYIGTKKGRPALWFYPLDEYLKSRNWYATDSPYVWLVKLRPGAWLQPVTRKTKELQQAPAGKERVGIIRHSVPPAAIFFKPAFDVVGKYYDYAGQHKRHGEVKGPAISKPSFFDRIRGIK